MGEGPISKYPQEMGYIESKNKDKSIYSGRTFSKDMNMDRSNGSWQVMNGPVYTAGSWFCLRCLVADVLQLLHRVVAVHRR